MTTPVNNTYWNWKEPPDAETSTVLGLGLVSLVLGLVHHRWVDRNYKFLHSICSHTNGIIVCVACYAVANAAQIAVDPATQEMFRDVMVLCKALYCYFFVSATLAIFKIQGWGGQEESIEAIVELLDKAGTTQQQQTNFIWFIAFWPCAGRRFYPTKVWLTSCVDRIRWGIYIILLNNFMVRRTCIEYGVMGTGDYTKAGYTKAKLYIAWIEAFAMMTVASGVLPLMRFLLTKVLVEGSTSIAICKSRMKVFVAFFGWVATVQTMLPWKYLDKYGIHVNTIVAVEMVLIQLAVHRAFVGPPFAWSPIRGNLETKARRGDVTARRSAVMHLLDGANVPSDCYDAEAAGLVTNQPATATENDPLLPSEKN